MLAISLLSFMCLFITAINGFNETTDVYPGHIILNLEQTDVELMANLSYTCYAKFDCLYLESIGIKCQLLDDIQWLLPRELREYHELNGNASSTRVHFAEQMRYFMNNGSNYLIKSHMSITDAGAVHTGEYQCIHAMNSIFSSVRLNITGAPSGSCHYDDQCRSYNCYDSRCRCEPSMVYDHRSDRCFNVSDLGQSCDHDIQCMFRSLENSTECAANRCACAKGYTLVNIAMNGKHCYEKVSLDSRCRFSDQCSGSDPHSYCSLEDKCECNSGYYLANNNTCVARKTCDSSHLDFNDQNFTRGGCDEHEFCRENVCLCQPTYRPDERGVCINSSTFDEIQVINEEVNKRQDSDWMAEEYEDYVDEEGYD